MKQKSEFSMICQVCNNTYKLLSTAIAVEKGRYRKTCSSTCATQARKLASMHPSPVTSSVKKNSKTGQFDVLYFFSKRKSDVFGLIYIPSLKESRPGSFQAPKNAKPDDIDWTVECDEYCSNWKRQGRSVAHQTENDFSIVQRCVSELNSLEKAEVEGPKCIVEIGVDTHGQHRKNSWPISKSFTYKLYAGKEKDTIYFGIDLKDKSYINDASRNIHTFKCNSFDQDAIREKLASLGVKTIDILLIDGYHSVNAMVNDWKYADMLSQNGVVLVHDINCHPGPRLVVDAIDPKQFVVTKHFADVAEHGIAEIRRVTA